MKLKTVGKSFKRELFVSCLIVASIPTIMAGTLLMRTFRARLSSDYEKEARSQVELVNDTVVDFLEDTDEVMISIGTNAKIVSGITDSDSWIQNKGYTELFKQTEGMREKAYFHIFDADGRCVYTTSTGVSSQVPTYWGTLKVAKTHPDEQTIKRAVMTEEENVSLQLARAIQKGDDCIGFVVAEVTEKQLAMTLEKAYDESNGIAILDSFWEEVYSTSIGKEEELARILRERRMHDEELKQDSDEVEFFISPIGETGLTLILGKEPILTGDITKVMWRVMGIIGVLSLILCLIVASVVSEYFTRPINSLTKAMEKVKGGDLSVSVHSSRKDELGQLSENFDRMTKELNEYMQLQVEQQRQLNDANIAMMQAQLNPHFLYNTLDTMKWVAKANNVSELAQMSADLAKILRTSISEKKFIPLSEELDLVEKYAEIQQIRFGGHFSYDAEVPMELEDYMIPKLIIQPIVENAIIHGFKEQDSGHIFLVAYERDGELHIEVTDNGCGISSEIIEKLNSKDPEQLKGHIGFCNVDTIIRLYYGENYGVSASRIPEGGTKVHMTLPITREVPGEQDTGC